MTTDKVKIGNIDIKVSHHSDFGDSYIIQCNYPFSWGHEIDFHNLNGVEIKSLNNSTVAIWRIKERKQLA